MLVRLAGSSLGLCDHRLLPILTVGVRVQALRVLPGDTARLFRFAALLLPA